jgi:hypothetical protein
MLAEGDRVGGLHFTYTPDPNELNAANLANDALMIYANHTTITPIRRRRFLISSTPAKVSSRSTAHHSVSRTRRHISRSLARSS